MQLWVNAFNVIQTNGLAEQLLVEGKGESAVQVVVVENGNANNAADKVKVGEVVLCFGGWGVVG